MPSIEQFQLVWYHNQDGEILLRYRDWDFTVDDIQYSRVGVTVQSIVWIKEGSDDLDESDDGEAYRWIGTEDPFGEHYHDSHIPELVQRTKEWFTQNRQSS